MEAMTNFNFLGFKITVKCGCSCEIKRLFLLRRKGVTNLDNVFKKKKKRERDITLPTKIHIIKARSFW